MDLNIFNDINMEDKLFGQECSKISSEIIAGRRTLVELVENLEGFLTNSSPEERAKGTSILSFVLDKLPVDLLSSTQINFICSFYCDRIKDHHQVTPAVLDGIVALTKFTNIPDGSATGILTNIFQHIPCQQQQQKDRLKIYKIFEGFLKNKTSELQAMSFDLVYGVITAMDSERDPNNLKFLFNWLPTFIKAINLGHLSEEMFEVMACYFPVDFRTPSQDPNQVTRNELAAALCPCLCGVPAFGEFCIPLAIEKLSSSLREAKIDSLHLLMEGCKTFDPEIYSNNINEIWSIVQTELFAGSNDTELNEICLNALGMVLNKISELDCQNGSKNFLKDKINSLKGGLFPTNEKMGQTTKFFACLAKSSRTAGEIITSEVLSLIMSTYTISSTVEQQKKIFEQFLEILATTHAFLKEKPDIKINAIQQCLKAVTHQENELRAMGFHSLSIVAPMLDSERQIVYTNLKLQLLNVLTQDVHSAMLKCLRTYAELYPEEVKEQVLNMWPLKSSTETAYYLQALREIVAFPFFMETSLDVYLENITCNMYPTKAFESLIQILKEHENNSDIYCYLFKKKALSHCLINWCFENVVAENIDRIIIDNIVEILKLFGSSDICKDSDCEDMVKYIFSTCKNGEKDVGYPLLYGVMCRRKCHPYITDELIYHLISVAASHSDLYFSSYACYLLVNIINKMDDEEKMGGYLNKVKEAICAEGISSCRINLITFITKALLMRGSRYYNEWFEKLLDIVNLHPQTLKILMSENYDCLCIKSNCRIRLLYRQRFFVGMTTNLIERYEKMRDINYILAYGFLMKGVPSKFIENSEALCDILEKLFAFLEDNDPIMEEYLEEFIPKLLKLTKFEQSMEVRIKALQCIKSYAKGYSFYKLIPFKQDVIFNLANALDDHKRLVRKEAVDTRLVWILLDAPM